MVSHAEVAESSRRAPSVSSRTSRSRQHHHRGRSHHGGSSYTPQNEFPFFAQSGDVEIVIACDGQEQKYLLHRLILAQFSGFFDAGTNDQWSRTQAIREAQQGSSSRPDQALTIIGEESEVSHNSNQNIDPRQMVSVGRKRWRYELNWDNLEEDEEPMLVQKPPSTGGIFASSYVPPAPPPIRPKPTPHGGFFRSMANLTLSHHHPSQSTAQLSVLADESNVNPLIRNYDNLFRTFYNFSPNLNTTNIAAAYAECKALLAIADIYDALPVVGPRIDHHLLRFSTRLFKQIAKYPPSYLKLGYLSRSRIIFSEAMIHVIGQWPSAYPYIKPSDNSAGGYEIPELVIDLIEDKVDELEELKQKIESKLFRLTLTTSRGERVNPSNDYLGWLAMSLWRQWLAENTTPEVRGILKNAPGAPARPGSNRSNATAAPGALIPAQPAPGPPPVNTGRVYRLIASTNSQAYLQHDELKRFLKIQPTSSAIPLYGKENMKRFERKMDEIKNVARDLVKPLTRNCLELDLRTLSDGQGGGLGYLTCMKIEEDELPWDLH